MYKATKQAEILNSIFHLAMDEETLATLQLFQTSTSNCNKSKPNCIKKSNKNSYCGSNISNRQASLPPKPMQQRINNSVPLLATC